MESAVLLSRNGRRCIRARRFSWVFTYGKGMKIVAPGEVAEKMKKMLAEVVEGYGSL